MDYISVRDASKKWSVSERSVHKYCQYGKIQGAIKFGKSWAIPASASKPTDNRRKNIKIDTSDVLLSNTKRIGALIVATSKFTDNEGISPFMDIGGTSLARRLVLIFQQAYISPVVVVTGYNALEIEHHLSDYSVIFLHNKDYITSDKFDCIKLGLKFLQDKCDRVFFTSLKSPMFMPETLTKMIDVDSPVVIPSFNGENGHPVLLENKFTDKLLSYRGDGGLRKALEHYNIKRETLPVDDEGIVLSVKDKNVDTDLISSHNEHLLHPFMRLSIEKNRKFFSSRSKMLIFLIKESNSVQGACRLMALSKSKAWAMINDMEKELGFTVVHRKQGGGKNRKTRLTKEGEMFLEFFTKYEDDIRLFARKEFSKRFTKLKTEIQKNKDM